MVKTLLAVLILAAGAGLAPPAGAADAEPEGWAYTLMNELMSPFCPGRSLADCPSPQADQLRMWLIVQEAAGRPRAEVEDELYDRYGDVIRARPRAEGFGLAAYFVPAAVFVAGGLLVAIYVRRQTRRSAPETPAPAVADPDLERLVDEELAG